MLSYFMVLALPLLPLTQTGKPQFLPSSTLLDDDLRVHCIHLSQDGKQLAVAGGSLKAAPWKVFDLATGKCLVNGLESNFRPSPAWGVSLSHDNSLLAFGGGSNSLFIVDNSTGKLYWDLTGVGHHGTINVYFTADRKYLITTASDMLMRVWDIENKKPHAVFRFTSPRTLAPQTLDRTEKAKLVCDIKSYYESIIHCAFAPDGTMAIAGNIHSEVPLVDLTAGKVVRTLTIKQDSAASLAFTSDGKWLVVGGGVKTAMIEIWDFEKNELVKSFGKHEPGILHLAISPDKKTIVTGSCCDGFRVWDVATGKQKFSYFTKEDPRMPRITPKEDPKEPPYVEHSARSAGVAFLPDGKTFLIAPHWTLWKTEIYFHDTATGEPVDYRKRVAALPQNAKPPR